MTDDPLIFFHFITVAAAFFLGAFLLATRKGSTRHKAIGKIYVLLILITATAAMFIPAFVGPAVNIFGLRWGVLHLLSALVFVIVVRAYFTARHGNIHAHKTAMVFIYVGGVVIAGAFAFMPGRMLHQTLFN